MVIENNCTGTFEQNTDNSHNTHKISRGKPQGGCNCNIIGRCGQMNSTQDY